MADITQWLSASVSSRDEELIATLYSELHQIAALLELSEPTIRKHWPLAKMWLYDAIREES